MSHPAVPSPQEAPLTPTAIAWSDPARQAAFGAWLAGLGAAHGLLPASLRPASADASFRRYFRVDTASGADCIIMDAPPDKEDCRPFVKVAGLMAQAGLKVPQVLAWDEPQGFMLLSDLGSQTMLDMIDPARPQANLALYLQALDALLAWQLASRPGVLPAYDEALLRRELELFPTWYLEKHRGLVIDSTLRGKLDTMFGQIIAHNLSAASVYVHRDFMPRNLMVAPPSEGTSVIGVLDFQDAVYGPISYDIASLMRDAFLSWEEDFVLDVTIRYWQKARTAGLPVADDFGEFYRAVEWMGLQRHLKVLGIFARLTLRDGKPKYLADTPRFIAYVRATAARYRELTPLLRLLDQVEGTRAAVGYAFGRV
jgi:hypothetical protein